MATNLQRKPALHLSAAPSSASSPSPSHTSSYSRRVGSWGSATSETYHALSAYGDQSMTPLPSPLEGREWGFLGGSDGAVAPGGSWQSGWAGGSVGTSGRPRGDSVFQEFRHPSMGLGGQAGSGSSWMDASAGRCDFGAFPSTSPDKGSSDGDGRRQPARSKTLSFFDSGDEPNRALSPPPNPPSRNNSLNLRSGPRVSTSSILPPSPGWETVQDPLRCSVASSSGGSWLDEAAGGSSAWARGRGASIGSVASTDGGGWQVPESRTPRHTSPHRPEPDNWDTPSPLAALRPRLAALSTSSASPDLSPASPNPSAFPQKPLSSLPSAVEPYTRSRFIDLDDSSNNVSRSSSALRHFVALGDQPTPSDSGAATPAGTNPPEQQHRINADEPPASASTSSLAPSDDDLAPLQRGDRVGDYVVERVLGRGSFSRVALGRLAKGKGRERDLRGHGRTASRDAGADGGLVALKLMPKKSCEANERMRISVMREVEVLKNIQHPSLVSLFTSFSTPVYTALVLDYCEGGELFDFLADWHPQVTEGLARRIFGELCSAVGWMHEIGLVHRDIKLENILLTSRPFPSTSPSALLSSLPTPFVKLTDFGLSRFINPASPLLATRCGSEEYAAPELIMGKKYDGRHTDAWALGVVLFAVITGVMPFVESNETGPRGRKAYLLKIAKADYRWPGSLSRAPSLVAAPPPRMSHPSHAASASEPGCTSGDAAAPPAPSTRLVTPAVQALVGRLLVRDPAKRAAVSEVWESEWMEGEGRPPRVRGSKRGSLMPDWTRRGSEYLDE